MGSIWKRTLTIGTLAILVFPTNAVAVEKVPKIGNCLNYVKSEVFDQTAIPKIVPCSGMHNSEVYRLILLKDSSNFSQLSQLAQNSIAENLCTPWKGSSKFLNQWTYKVPNISKWKSGDLQLRCEAIKIVEPTDGSTLLIVSTWKGKKLDFK